MVQSELTLRTAGSTSTIVVEAGGLAQVGQRLATQWPHAHRVFVVTHPAIETLYGEQLQSSLAAAGLGALTYSVPPGEESKTLAQAGPLYDWLAAARAERGEPVLAFGGGVIGDLAGFVAATYLRGVPLAQLPTTLLAMVDSSVGGKTGVNLPRGKNLVGAFYQPALVVADPTLLRTLPPRELRSGLAEVVKYGLLDRSVPGLGTPPLAPLLAAQREALRVLGEPVCSQVIRECITIKAAIVQQDERETGLRRILNLGHTIGHAIEAEAGYGRYTHGEAVALGLRGVSRLAARTGFCGVSLVTQIDQLLDAYDLPRRIAGCSAEALLARIGSDKKVSQGQVHWVVPTELGRVTVSSTVALDQVRETLLELGATV